MKLTAEYFLLSQDVSAHRQQLGSHSAETLVQKSLQQNTPASVNTNKRLLMWGNWGNDSFYLASHPHTIFTAVM